MHLDGLTVLVTGGTGSLGGTVVRRILSGEMGAPKKILIFSRDENKHYAMRIERPEPQLEFCIGDVRDYASLLPVLSRADIVIHTAAMKQVPLCESFPFEAVQTNIIGAQNVIRAIRDHRLPVRKVIGISTDKACKPLNVMGMTKAIQERILLAANETCPETSFMVVRYGNVIASRGSVIPLFRQQVDQGGPVTVTHPEMTRFLFTLDQAVNAIFEAIRNGEPGETWVPEIPSARVLDIAKAIIGDRPIEIREIGIRPGEKLHEILISEEESLRTSQRVRHFVIQPNSKPMAFPTIQVKPGWEYSSRDCLLSLEAIRDILSSRAAQAVL